MKLSGAQIVMEVLLEQGVDTVFGYPGGNVLNIYDALLTYNHKISHILTAHEQGASHAADGYARTTGRVGVCIATSGPGATNLVTGIATAYMDSSPVVFITGNVSSNLIGRDAFQEADITGITIPITKNNYMVADVSELADTLREAFYIAQAGRPGPVLVDIPNNVASQMCEFSNKALKHKFIPEIEGDLDAANKLIKESMRPTILIGGGAKGAREQVRHLARQLNAPVVSTMMGLGILPSDEENYYGMIGMHGMSAANAAIAQSDLIIAVGTRFSDRVLEGSLARKRILHIDIDRAEINKNISTACAISGDAADVLEKLSPNPHALWFESADALNTCDECSMMHYLAKIAGDDAIIVTEVGEHQIAVAQYFPLTAKNTILTPGGFGTMGFGLGAAIGASLACPERRVLHIAGDGSFRMNMIELATVARLKLPIITVICDNGVLGMVRTWQDKLFDGRHSQVQLSSEVDYRKLAEAFGLKTGSVLEIDGPGVYIWNMR